MVSVNLLGIPFVQILALIILSFFLVRKMRLSIACSLSVFDISSIRIGLKTMQSCNCFFFVGSLVSLDANLIYDFHQTKHLGKLMVYCCDGLCNHFGIFI